VKCLLIDLSINRNGSDALTSNFSSLENTSTDDDEDEITWTCLQRDQHRMNDKSKNNNRFITESKPMQVMPKMPPGKPPRAAASASLDRRQRSRSQSNRRERDSKSRSTHSLRDKDLNEKILISDKLAKDHSSSSCSNKRMSPVTWEVPPPPPCQPPWDYHYYKHHLASREDLRSLEFYRRPVDPYRMGNSFQELCHHPSTLSLSGTCDSSYCHYPPPPQSQCCGGSNHNFYGQVSAMDGLFYIEI